MDNYFKTRYSFTSSRQKVWKIIANYLQKYIPRDAIICDLGPGYCDFINNITAKEKHALDISDEIKKYANPDIVTHISSIYKLSDLKSKYFDIVFSSNTLEHLTGEQVELTLEEIKRILKPKGNIILMMPNFKFCYKVFYDDYTHKTPFTHIGLCDLLETKNLKPVKVMSKFLPFSFKNAPACYPLSFLVRLYLYSPVKPFAGQMLVVAKKE